MKVFTDEFRREWRRRSPEFWHGLTISVLTNLLFWLYGMVIGLLTMAALLR